jgi:LytR cell envelope-related transcriptional attenuator/LytR_cpsA_psr family
VTGKRAAPKAPRHFGRSRPAPEDGVEESVEASLPALAHAGTPGGRHRVGTTLPPQPPQPPQPPPPQPPPPTAEPPPALPVDAAPVVAAPPPDVAPVVVPPVPTRGLARREYHGPSRRLWIVLAAALALLLVVAVAVYVGHRGNKAPPVTPAAVGPNSVVLLQVTNSAGAAAVALLGDQHGSDGAVVFVPSQLAVAAGAFGGVSVQKAATLPGNATADAMSDALGVKISGTWTLTTGGLAALVESIGGVNANVDVDVIAGGVIQVPAGQQHLDGVAAAAYATYAVAGEPAQTQLARLSTVLQAVIAGLPTQPAAVTQVLAALGAGSRFTLPLVQLSGVLADLQALDATNSLEYESLPVHEIDAGDTTYTVDTTGAVATIHDLTGITTTASTTAAVGVRVLVRNGVGTPGLGETTRARINKAGDTYIAGGNQLPFDRDLTVILITDDTPAQRALGDKVAADLGVPVSALRVSGEGQSIADVIVVLGTDYHP